MASGIIIIGYMGKQPRGCQNISVYKELSETFESVYFAGNFFQIISNTLTLLALFILETDTWYIHDPYIALPLKTKFIPTTHEPLKINACSPKVRTTLKQNKSAEFLRRGFWEGRFIIGFIQPFKFKLKKHLIGPNRHTLRRVVVWIWLNSSWNPDDQSVMLSKWHNLKSIHFSRYRNLTFLP